MPAAAEMHGDRRHVDRIRRGTRHHLDVRAQIHQDEQPVGVEQVAQLVGQGGYLLDLRRSGGLREEYPAALDSQDFRAFQQAVVQFALGRGKRMIEERCGEGQVGALLEQPGGGAHVARGGAGVGKRAGVFVDPQEKERGFLGRQRLREGLQGFDQQRGARADRIHRGRPPLRQCLVRRVMIHRVHARGGSHAADGRHGLRIHQRHPVDSSARQIIHRFERQRVAVQRQECVHVAVRPVRKHGVRIRFQ